jgi:hypothetical protein
MLTEEQYDNHMNISGEFINMADNNPDFRAYNRPINRTYLFSEKHYVVIY